jgi:predicted AAA+ superfamily ATPase
MGRTSSRYLSNLESVKKNLAQLFKTPPERIEKLFSGRQVTLNNNLDEKTAQDYVSELQTAGAICIVEPMPEAAAKQVESTSKSAPPSTVISSSASSARATSKRSAS